MKRQTAKEYLAVADQILSLSPREERLGAPQTCPTCNRQNSSGRRLPEQCRWCGDNKRIVKIRNVKRLEALSLLDDYCPDCDDLSGGGGGGASRNIDGDQATRKGGDGGSGIVIVRLRLCQ